MTSPQAIHQSVIDTLPGAQKIVDTVVKVHGDNHPNLSQVKTDFGDLFSALNTKDLDKDKLADAQNRLRSSAENFETPADGCEGYKMMNEQLSTIDGAVTTLLNN